MAYDSDGTLRDMLRPQDALAGLITLLGIAIAIFLPDAIVKLIGACIGVLGGIALYMTLRGRMADSVQIRKKRTTLPPPSFKTHVTTDPQTSAKRIRFDDFKETFHVDEEDEPAPKSPSRRRGAPPVASATYTPPAPPGSKVRFDDLSEEYADDTPPPLANPTWSGVSDANVEAKVEADYNPDFNAGSGLDVETDPGEGFRIIPAPPKSTSPQEKAEASPPVEEPVARTEPKETAPPPSTAERKKKRGRKKRGGERREENVAVRSPETRSPEVAEETTTQPTPDPTLTTTASESAETELTATEAPQKRADRKQIQMVLSELTPESDEKEEGEPRADFVRLVNQILKAIARSIDGRSIVFFWMNLERGHFIPEACVTRGEVSVRLGERIKLGNDLVSQIAQGGVPEIITNISPAAENELAPYYREKTGTRSFVGVPVFYRQEVVGVLAADSADESGFDEASVATLAEYTILISQLIRDYAEKFDLYLMRRSIEAFEQLNTSMMSSDMRPREIARFLVEQVAGLFDVSWSAAVLYNKKEGRWWVPAAIGEEKQMVSKLKRLEPDMGKSVAGEAARSAQEIYLPEVAGETLIMPGEEIAPGGSFLAVPLMASAKCYGSLLLGNDRPNAWVSRDVDLLRDLSRYVAMAIEVVNTNDALAENMIYDEQTGLFNGRYFLGGFDREIDRARDFKSPLSLALLRVEPPAGFAPESRGEVHHLSITEIGQALERKIRPYDLIGRFDEETFGVALIGKSDQEAYLWAERFRKEIAGRIIPFESRSFSVTISAGVCNATDSSDRNRVIEGAEKALEKAAKGGGNGVVIY